VDNLCHTLVGAALGEAGLKQRTRFGNATLMVAANIPDIDVLVFLTGTSSLPFRRGITHGVAAQLLLPLLVAVAMMLLARRRAAADDQPLRVGWLLVLAYLGAYSHVFLDFLNTYGVRLLTPVSWRCHVRSWSAPCSPIHSVVR
jgi:inner membrane protein